MDSKYDFFCKVLPHSFLLSVLNPHAEDREDGLLFSKGKVKKHTIKPTIFVPLSILAVRVLIQGCQDSKKMLPEAVKDAVAVLKETNSTTFCTNLMEMLLSMYWFGVGTDDEYQISEHMGNIFSAFGDSMLGNKKLYGYSGNSGFVRMVRSKPDNVGLWMYQEAVVLKCGLSSLIYSTMQLFSMEGNVRMKAADIVKDWGNLIIDHIVLNKTFLCMDG